MTHIVVLCLLLVVGKHTVCLVDLLEFLFCTRLLAYIRMEFPCKVAIRLFNLFIVSTTGYSKDIVVIRNMLSPRHFYLFFTIMSIMRTNTAIISGTHTCSLFFHFIVGIYHRIIGFTLLW